VKIAVAAKRAAKCDGLLGGLEQFTCAWAQKTSDRCKSYNSCYDTAAAAYKKLRRAVPKAVKSRKAEYKAGMRMQCMAAAVGSGGTVDAKKMNACKTKGFDLSVLNVKIPRKPRKKSCTAPQTYGGSKKYKRKVYRRLPVKVREPTLCLAWKGGCAARATFAGAIVHLKRNGKYCSLRKGMMQCSGRVPKQRFKFQSHTSTCGGAKLVPYPSRGRQCRFAPSTGAPYVYCGRKRWAKAWATLTSNPLAVSRTNMVTLKFAPLKASMTLGSKTRRWTRWDGRVHFRCNSGALAAIESRWSSRKKDRSWKHQCRNFPRGVGAMGRWPRGFRGMFKWRMGWMNMFKYPLYMECENGAAIAGHKSKHVGRHWGRKVEDRQFQWACRRLPRGVKMLGKGTWSKSSTKAGASWKLGCNSDEVLVGLISHYKRKTMDRIWKRKCAKVAVRPPTPTTFSVEYEREV
jgi:hypothetical protein